MPRQSRPLSASLPSPVKAHRQTSKYAAKREAIVEAAVRLFNQRGLKGVSLAEVAHSVGLVTNSVTYYFKKKEDLAAACYLRAIEAVEALFIAAAREPTPGARLQRCVTLYFNLLKDIESGQRPPLVVFDDIRALSDSGTQMVFDAYTNMFRRARSLLQTDERTPIERRAANARTHLFLSLIFWVPAWIYRYETEDYDRVAARINDILAHGLPASHAPWPALSVPLAAPAASTTEISREAFLRAATDLINEQGYRGASVEMISARLNVTKGSFYHHNENKDDLVVECFERTFAVIRQAQNAAAAVGNSGWARLCAAVSTLIQHQMSADGPLLRTSALHAVPEPTRIQMVIRMNRLSDRFASFIVDGIADGSIRPVDPFIAGQLVNPMINGAAELHRWVPGITADAVTDLYVRPLLEGLAAPTR